MDDLDVSTIRRFLLGDLDETSRRSIEEESLENDDLFDRIELVEAELIEDYLSSELLSSERRIFEETLATVPGRRRRVETIRALTARGKTASPDSSNVTSMKARIRYASHARLAIAAGFAGAAITAVAFFQAREGSPAPNPPLPATASASTSAPSGPALAQPTPQPETSSAMSVRRPGTTIPGTAPSTTSALVAGSTVTLLLSAGAPRSAVTAPTLDLRASTGSVEIQIAVDDNEFSHYNAELRAADGTTIASPRNISVTALRGAPVIRMSVPAASFTSGRHELVLAGVHEEGAEEIAYIEFDVRK